ncbi:Nn.00g030100.m01.CDS01 [Neocucurbitaria sp. VM-36]
MGRCREEHWTRENSAVPRLRQQLRFRSICERWPNVIRQAMIRIRRNRIQAAVRDKLKFEKQLMHTKRKIRVWKKQAKVLRKELVALSNKYTADPTSVSPKEWDEASRGSKGRLQYLLGARYPRANWPANVPYLNVIALKQWQGELQEKQRKERINEIREAMREEEKKNFKVSHERPLTNGQQFLYQMRPNMKPSKQYQIDMAERNAEIKKLERFLVQRQNLRVLLLRCQIDPTRVTLKEWEDATEGTDILETSKEIARFVEVARKREVSGANQTLIQTVQRSQSDPEEKTRPCGKEQDSEMGDT